MGVVVAAILGVIAMFLIDRLFPTFNYSWIVIALFILVGAAIGYSRDSRS